MTSTDPPGKEKLDMAEIKELITEIDKDTSTAPKSTKPVSLNIQESLPSSVSNSSRKSLSSLKASPASSSSAGNTRHNPALFGGQRPVSSTEKYRKHSRPTGSSSSTASTRKILSTRSTKSSSSTNGTNKPLKRKASVAFQPSDHKLIELYEKNIHNDYSLVPKKRKDREPWHPDASAPTISREDFCRYQRLVEAQIRRLRLERDEYRRMWNWEKSRADSGVKRFRETRERIQKEVENDYKEFNEKLRSKRNEPQWPPPPGPGSGDMNNKKPASRWPYDNFEDQMSQHFVTVTLVAAESELLVDRDEEAETLVLEALEVARGLDYPPLEARCKYWLGRIEYFREHEEKALQYFMEARPCDGKYMEGAELQLYLSLFQPGLTKQDREQILLNNDRALLAAHEKVLRDRKKKKNNCRKQKGEETTKGKDITNVTAKETDDLDNYQFVIDPRKLPIEINARGIKRKMDDRPENLIFRRPWIRPRKKAVKDVTKLSPTLWITSDNEPPTKVPRARTTHRSIKGKSKSKSNKKGKKNLNHHRLPSSSVYALPPQTTARNSTGFNLTGRYSDLSWLFASLNLNLNSSSKSSSRGNRPPQSKFTFSQHLLGPSQRSRQYTIWPEQWWELRFRTEVWESQKKTVIDMKWLERERNTYRRKAAPIIRYHEECERLRYLVRVLFPTRENTGGMHPFSWDEGMLDWIDGLNVKELSVVLGQVRGWWARNGRVMEMSRKYQDQKKYEDLRQAEHEPKTSQQEKAVVEHQGSKEKAEAPTKDEVEKEVSKPPAEEQQAETAVKHQDSKDAATLTKDRIKSKESTK
ncbi:hypothetical protein VTN00DRAFT_3863 [Thermoascus crustaceus]|uniref:uncharacterized protein n=1 Tax=Thermoascus crustaceus TaxID=5088 RepID=UPI003743A157